MQSSEPTSADNNSAKWRSKLRDVFSIDLRTLAAFRIVLATLLIVDLLDRLAYVRMFYTNFGLVNAVGAERLYGTSIRWTSLHYYTANNVWLQAAMIAVSLLAAACLLIGYRTRIATIASWVLLVSLARRMPTILNGGDDIMRIMLIWSVFLPLGAVWSLDAIRSQRIGKVVGTQTFFSMATIAILLQVCYIYIFTSILKLHPSWLGGHAIRQAMELDFHVRPLGQWLARQSVLLPPLTYLTLCVEATMPFVALSPWRNSLCRICAVVVMVGLHSGIALLMTIGLFPFVSIMCWLLFVPSVVWDYLLKPQRDVVADRSHWFENSRTVSIVVFGLLAIVTAYNILGLDQLNARGIAPPRTLVTIAKYLRVDQKWKMYAPTPNVADGWFVIPGLLDNGQIVDLFTGRMLTYDKAAVVSDLFPSMRIKSLLLRHRAESNHAIWQWIARYYALEWNQLAAQTGTSKVLTSQVIFIGEYEHGGDVYYFPYVNYDVAKNEATFLPGSGMLGATPEIISKAPQVD